VEYVEINWLLMPCHVSKHSGIWV